LIKVKDGARLATETNPNMRETITRPLAEHEAKLQEIERTERC
jgi:hypothetical protein